MTVSNSSQCSTESASINGSLYVDNKKVVISGRLRRIARISSEGYEFVQDPVDFLGHLYRSRIRANVFTFLQRLCDPQPHYAFQFEPAQFAVLRFESYDKWWKEQINDKTRNMVRKAGKKGITLQCTELTDDFVRGIQSVYNECPIRQGKPFRHYGKGLDTLRREHSSFLDRSQFIGAYFEGQLIGFVKLVYQGEWATMMNIISKISARDKAPTNALIAKAVELCAGKGIRMLHYGIWSRRSFGDFKLHHGFQRLEVPRYYVPLNATGQLLLKLGLHKSVIDRLPERWLDKMFELRSRWYYFKYRKSLTPAGQ